jgi:alpha-L-rhamnosidase
MQCLLAAVSLWMGANGFAAPPGQDLSSVSLRVVGMRCEHQNRPLGIDHPAPRLSWVLESAVRGQKQTACRILVADSEDALHANRGTLWDSGKVVSERNIDNEYAGKRLISGQRVHWKVMVWDRDGHATDWSTPSSWEMGLLQASDWKGQWICDGRALPEQEADFYQDDPAPLFRREFNLTGSVRRARLYITGLGYYQATLNGKTVGDHCLDPLWTRPDKRVFYDTYDVTGQLAEGDNCLGVTVGNGWYNPLPLRMWGRVNLRERLPVGRPRFIAQLSIEYADGSRTSVISDTSWKWTSGPILRNSIYLGEKYDARKEIPGWDRPGFDDGVWASASEAPAPGGVLQAAPLPPIKVTRRLKPLQITESAPGVYIADMGQNFGGWASLTFDVPAGTSIGLRYGELLDANGALNPMTSVCGQIKGKSTEPNHPGPPGIAWQTDTYIARGGGPETYTPRFTFHAFRYVEITGLPKAPSADSIEGLRMNCALQPVGTFACSNDLFNRIQTMCEWTFLSNVFGVQSDCPHRERFGYGGDLVTTSDAFMLNYDMAGFYAKAARDWHDSALADGMLTDTAPSVGIQYCGVGWAMAHPLLQLQLYRYYGDRRIVEEQYATAKRWFDLVRVQTPDFILKTGLHDHECLQGEKAPPMVTPLYCESARMLSRLARILGREEEANDYQRLAEQIKQRYASQFVAAGTGVVASGGQAAQAFALALDMLPEGDRPAAIESLVRDIEEKHGGHLTTGIFGTKYMLDALSREGRVETAYRVVHQRDFPGWGFMLEQGATTLWEHWKFSDNTFSHNHPMFGSVSQWFYNWLGGIEPAPDAVGFDRILLHPRFVDGLDWVNCGIDTVRGRVTCNWKRTGGRIVLTIQVPVNTTAMLDLPAPLANALTENGRPADTSEGVEKVAERKGAAMLRLVSGAYQFEMPE